MKKKHSQTRRKCIASLLLTGTLLTSAVIPAAADQASDYASASALLEAGSYQEAVTAFRSLGSYQDSADLLKEAIYGYAGELSAQGLYKEAADQYGSILEYKDSRDRRYMCALRLRAAGELEEAFYILNTDWDYRDSKAALYQLALDAADQDLYWISTLILGNMGDYKESYAKLVTISYRWGDYLYSQGDYDGAVEVFRALAESMETFTSVGEAELKKFFGIDNVSVILACADAADRANESAYAAATAALQAGNYDDAKERFTALGDYLDSKTMIKECGFCSAMAVYAGGDYESALNLFTQSHISGYKDSAAIMNECRYQLGLAAMSAEDYQTAAKWFKAAGSYQDSQTLAAECESNQKTAKARILEQSGDYERC